MSNSRIKPNLSARLPGMTIDQIDLLTETYGLTKTQIVMLAIDRLTRDLNPERGDRSAIRQAWKLADENGIPTIPTDRWPESE